MPSDSYPLMPEEALGRQQVEHLEAFVDVLRTLVGRAPEAAGFIRDPVIRAAVILTASILSSLLAVIDARLERRLEVDSETGNANPGVSGL